MSSAALSGLLIYGFIHLRSTSLTVLIDTYRPTPQVTTDPGVYLNNYLIPLSKMKNQREIEIPYGVFSSNANDLSILVNGVQYEAHLFSNKGSGNFLEARLDPAKKHNEGIDGITLRGNLHFPYTIKIIEKIPNIDARKEYTVKLTP